MRLRTKVTLAVAVAVLGVGGGVAAADYHGNDSHGGYPDKPRGEGKKGKKGKKWSKGSVLPTGLTHSSKTWTTYMSGASEVDDAGNPGVGDDDALGFASFMPAGDSLCYGVSVQGMETPAVFHIHRGKAGENGPPVIEFTNVPANADGDPSGNPGASSGCKPLEGAELDAMQTIGQQARKRVRKAEKKGKAPKPLNYYANVHTDELGGFPAGAVRGQLNATPFQEVP